MTPLFFANQIEFRKWLKKNHKKETELTVGFYKIASGKPSMTWSQSVDEALCFGWIDSIRKSVDEESYSIRFTPRRKTSNWSAINIDKVEKLIEQGLMQPEGFAAYENRKDEKSRVNSYENAYKLFSDTYKDRFSANTKAWDYFKSQSKSYQKMIIHWILDAKQEKTKLSRLEKAIAESEKGEKLFR